MKRNVMTVTGPISTDQLGMTLMHEHFAFAFPGWYADDSLAPYDREAAEGLCLKVLKDLKEVGVKTVVDATPADVGGRDPVLLKSLSEKSGINIIAVTGIYTEMGGASSYYKFQSTLGGRNLEQDLYELFLREITVGITLDRNAGQNADRMERARVIPASENSGAPTMERRSDMTLLFHLKANAKPFSSSLFRENIGITPSADEDWRWSIVSAKGVRVGPKGNPAETLPAAPQLALPAPVPPADSVQRAPATGATTAAPIVSAIPEPRQSPRR